MSRYTDMWEKIHEMSTPQIEWWIAYLKPTKGKLVLFQGMHVHDIDAIVSLRNALITRKSAELRKARELDRLVHPFID